MFDLPAHPDVYKSRLIVCVSCQEKFTITEGHRAKSRKESKWRLRPNVPSNVNLYYNSNRQQRPVKPAPNQIPHPLGSPINAPQPFPFTPYPVNCPRCGADNRNWVALKEAGKGNFLQVWQQRFPKVLFALFISFLFGLSALLLPRVFGVSWLKAIILAISTPMASALLIFDLSDKWNKLRLDKHVAKILSKSRRVETTLWLQSLGWLIVASFVLPILLFSAGPAAFQKIVEFIDRPPEEEVEAAAQNVAVDFDNQVNQTVENINSFGREVGERIEAIPDGDFAQIEQQLERLSDDLENTAAVAAQEVTGAGQEGITLIEAQLENELSLLKEARRGAQGRLANEITGSVRFLAVWSFILGLPLLLTIMVTMPAVKKFVARVDTHLPPPVFYSVANMTRLVAWEARQALEIGDQHFDIQWMSVQRNDQGGIDLVGLFRDPPDFDALGQVRSSLVRAQRHTIHTDRWCRVVRARVSDVMVPIPAGAPAGAFQPVIQSEHDAPATVRIRLPNR